MPVKHPRSLVKALTYRCWGTLISLVGTWMVCGDIAAVIAVVSGETLVKIIGYYAHERLWATVAWGKEKT